jgi:adenine-specific DNA methylase
VVKASFGIIDILYFNYIIFMGYMENLKVKKKDIEKLEEAKIIIDNEGFKSFYAGAESEIIWEASRAISQALGHIRREE